MSVDSSANGADKGKGCLVREVLWFCGNFGVDAFLGSDVCYGGMSWYTGGDQICLNQYCIDAYSSGFIDLVEEALNVWDTCDKADSDGGVVTLLYIV